MSKLRPPRRRLCEQTALIDISHFHLQSSEVTYSRAPGYRDVGLTFDLSTQGADPPSFRATLWLSSEDGARIVANVGQVHGFAWKRGEPLDIRPGEKPPRWVGALA